MTEVKTDSEASTIDTCVQHAREILASQLPQVKDKGYDFAPLFRQMTIQLYLVGVMWRCSESLGVAGDARDHAFEAMQSMLIADGMKKKEAQQRIIFLRKIAKAENGTDTLAASTRYVAGRKH